MMEPAPPYRGEGPHALWHVSEDATIERFGAPLEERSSGRSTRATCRSTGSRATARARPSGRRASTSDDDVERWLDGDRTPARARVESAWLERMRTTRLVAYRLPEASFEPEDRFWVSRETVEPLELVELGDLLARHAEARDRAARRAGALSALGRGRRVDARLQRHPAAKRDTVGMRILVAEDETIIRLDLKDLLERAGHEVCAEARDGEEAVELARSEQPDLAIMDVKMPRLDGIEAARRIQDERPIPIVMLTAYGQEELVSRAAEAGVFGYLVKPFREQDLLPAIQTARARHEEMQTVRDEAESLAEALAARKVIERAKGLLMEKEKLDRERGIRAAAQGEPGVAAAAEGDRRGRRRDARGAARDGRPSERRAHAARLRRVRQDARQISAALCRDIVWRVPGSTAVSGEYQGPPRGRRVPPPHRARDRRDVRQQAAHGPGERRVGARGLPRVGDAQRHRARRRPGVRDPLRRRHVEGRHRGAARRRVRCVLGLSRSTRPT